MLSGFNPDIQLASFLSMDSSVMMADHVKPCNSYFHIDVRNPRTHIKNDKAVYTDYEIQVKTNNIAFSKSSSKVRRRYSEFMWLRHRLNFLYGNDRKIPKLPERCLFGRFKKIFIAKRQKGLTKFLKDITSDPIYLSDTAIHLFLQTNLSIHSMVKKLSSNDSGDELSDLLQYCSLDKGYILKDNEMNSNVTKSTFIDEDSGYFNSSSMEEEGLLQSTNLNLSFNSLTDEVNYIDNTNPLNHTNSLKHQNISENIHNNEIQCSYEADDEIDIDDTDREIDLFIPFSISTENFKFPLERALCIIKDSYEYSKIRNEQYDSEDEFNEKEYDILDSDECF